MPKLGRRMLVAWLVVSLVTLAYLGLDYSVDRGGANRASVAVTLGAVAIALVKVRIIFREFMEVRHAPVVLMRLVDVWIGIIAVSLVGSYLLGLAR